LFVRVRIHFLSRFLKLPSVVGAHRRSTSSLESMFGQAPTITLVSFLALTPVALAESFEPPPIFGAAPHVKEWICITAVGVQATLEPRSVIRGSHWHNGERLAHAQNLRMDIHHVRAVGKH
jgi:hypothetical protein